MPPFSLLSLNTFGVPFYLSTWRIKLLAAELNRLAPTVICLQEIQQSAYLLLLQNGLTAYPTRAFYRNRFAPKGGLFWSHVETATLTAPPSGGPASSSASVPG